MKNLLQQPGYFADRMQMKGKSLEGRDWLDALYGRKASLPSILPR